MVHPVADTRALAILLLIATALPALGVSAALGSISFSLKGRAAPKRLPRRAEVLLFVVSLVVPVLFLPVLWSSNIGFVEGTSSPGAYLLGAVPSLGALAFALLGGTDVGLGRRSLRRTALVLASASCLMYAAPALPLSGYVFRGA